MNETIRQQFPILSRDIYGKPLIYLDNAATTQKPRSVVEAMVDEYYNVNANVHRGVHFLSQKATDLHEASRERTRTFIGAERSSEIIFTRGTTESINLMASCLRRLYADDTHPEVIVTQMEHHSNIVPWQINGFTVKAVPMTDDGQISLDEMDKLFSADTRIVSVAHVSNVLGTINPVKEIVRLAHSHKVPVLIDGAQSTPHFKVDVKELDCDFFAFSGHKIYGPTGIGVLYGKEEWLDRLPPYQGGGEMIDHVSFEKTTFNVLPYKFEAGTPDYVATHSLAKALDFVCSIGMDEIHRHEKQLTLYALEQMREIYGMHIYGEPDDAVISFNLSTEDARPIHHLDVGTLLDRLGIAVRTGHHCAEPLMRRLGIEGTVRASFALYNTTDEIDAFVAAIRRVQGMF